MILISGENGSSRKTYGVNGWKSHNMKFTFLCIVITLSCSFCVSGAMGIYPGARFKFDKRRLYREIADRPLFPFPLDGRNDKDITEYPLNEETEPYYKLRLPKVLFDQGYDKYLNQDSVQNPKFRQYAELTPSLENLVRKYNDIQRVRKYNNLQSNVPDSEVLDESRQYPNEDDFVDDNDEGYRQFFEYPNMYARTKSIKDRHFVKASTPISFEREGFGNVKLQEDYASSEDRVTKADAESLLAYAPSDPRYYENFPLADPRTPPVLPKPQSIERSTSGNNILIQSRSNDKFEKISPLTNYNVVHSQQDQESTDSVVVHPRISPEVETAGVYIIAIVAGISAAATVGLIAVGIGWYNLQKHVKNASDVEYPAYGVTGPNKDISPSSGDRRLAQSAQMYHYQHQKQQIIAMESRAGTGERHGSVSEADSDEENEEGDYTVYECPGLAPTGEMEVKNPLFQDDPTPAQTPPVKPEENK